MASIWDLLMQAVGPQEADATVVAKDPQAQALLDATRSGATMPEGSPERNLLVTGRFDPLKRAIFQQILAAAEARPETVTVEHAPEGLPGGSAGSYTPTQSAVRLNVGPLRTEASSYPILPPTSLPAQQTLSHELLHFLGGALQRQWTNDPDQLRPNWFERLFGQSVVPSTERMLGSAAAQHALIRYLLGADQAPGVLTEYATQRPFSEPPPMRDFLERRVVEKFIQEIIKDPEVLKRAQQGLEPR